MEQLNLSWLRRARREKKLSLEKAGAILGKDRSTMWRYENGHIPLTVDGLFKLLSAYDKSITDVVMVVGGEDAGI